MAIAGRACVHTILIVGLALICCEAKGVPRAARRGANGDPFKGKTFGRSNIVGSNEKVFNVLQFGAKPDGRKDCTEPFIRAWRATCDFKGSSRLLIPGGTFLISQVVFGGPCNGPTPKIVQVSGTVKATTDVSEYSSAEWVLFEAITGLIVTGSGTFDGQGGAVWKYNDCKGNNNCVQLPSNIKFNKVTNGLIRGLTSLNSKGTHLFITNSENIRARNLHIRAPADSPNTDGIHVSHSNNVRIAKTSVSTGDDCISIVQGATNVAINKLTCGPGHGISVGSLGKYHNEEDVRGIIVKNCTLTGTQNGVRIKTWPGSDPSAAFGMLFQNIVMNYVRNPIIIDQGYCAGSHGCNKSGNLKLTSSSKSHVQQDACQNVQFNNIDLKFRQKGMAAATATCDNAKVGYSGRQNPPPCRRGA
ncbi:hypothetical protein CJ030_MR5G017203 [Morella rubra]|uniref:Exopolygalacturonase n=1 Tax=Morella rubra TaxID=262757 RepID=A0A6A1VTE3_9ROSI|nr:hypothetical protein CJ030_MR5G017203 [Morella rubra]